MTVEVGIWERASTRASMAAIGMVRSGSSAMRRRYVATISKDPSVGGVTLFSMVVDLLLYIAIRII